MEFLLQVKLLRRVVQPLQHPLQHEKKAAQMAKTSNFLESGLG